jgi:hypothetical protein
VVRGRKINPSTGSSSSPWKARCRYVVKIHVKISTTRGKSRTTRRSRQGIYNNLAAGLVK